MSRYDSLNNRQQEAVYHTEGPVLLLAGAGSGKTRVLMHRIAYLIDEKEVDPYHIMAITFTNKAAKEMKERIDKLGIPQANEVWVATFHSTCVRILRRFIDRLGFDNNFSIYDTDDQKTLMKRIFKELNLDSKYWKERAVLSQISNFKNELITPTEAKKYATDYREQRLAEIYQEYQRSLRSNNALDFDDLLVKTVELFEKYEEVLEYYQERFRYIMVDEYQDTNRVQFRFIELLSAKYKNLCVVGDDDQSIYKFRGADISNILGFEKVFPGAKVIKLEQNYRSTTNIIAIANAVIKHNKGRKDKTLWTDIAYEEKTEFYQFDSAHTEADRIIADIRKRASDGNYDEFAILYRTNAQSRLFEERCIAYSLPYQMVGGVNFYQRKEIKDIVAYIKTIANGRDDEAVRRIINVPKRGIGGSSIDKISIFAKENNVDFYEALEYASSISGSGKSGEKIRNFLNLINDMKTCLHTKENVAGLIEDILEKAGYKEYLYEEGEVEASSRLENIQELKNKAAEYKPEELNLFLEDIALVADIDRFEETTKAITLMTLHASKGLEFPYVYLSGMDEGLFPSEMSISSGDKDDVEEERRLCYVGITRAKKKLILTSAKSRMLNGRTIFYMPSRFVEEIPDELMDSHILDTKKRLQEQRNHIYIDGLPWKDDFDKRPRSVSKVERPQPSFGKRVESLKAETLDYAVGDRIRSSKFGEGIVKGIENGTKDYTVTIEFDHFGTKKMLAGFAKLEKI